MALCLTSLLLLGCSRHGAADSSKMSDARQKPDTLRVGTLFGPTTYFLYRDEPMGYEYEMVCRFANSAGMPLKITIARNRNELLDMLNSGKVDLLACQIPLTSDYKDKVRPCGETEVTVQVLVQPKHGQKLVADVTQLIGRRVSVERNSKYQHRLENLNQEVGGGIEIELLDMDSIITEDLVDMVDRGKIDFTVIDSDMAALESTYHPDLDISLPLSLEQRSSWAVRRDNPTLAAQIDKWAQETERSQAAQLIHRRYFEQAKHLVHDSQGDNSDGHSSPQVATMLNASTISSYDAIFRTVGESAGIDWRLLAAVGFVESRFDNSVVSWAGARGIMQIMPRTARANGLNDDEITDPKRNIATAAKIFSVLDGIFRSKVSDSRERIKFVLAAYNAGHGHILDAIALARKYNLDPTVWDGNVCEALLMKSRPEYYSDPVVKSGYFRGSQTSAYVRDVMNAYDYYISKLPS